MTTIVGQEWRDGGYMCGVLHVPGSSLTLKDDANGGKKAVLDVVAVTLENAGRW